jgi:hypothetical protein
LVILLTSYLLQDNILVLNTNLTLQPWIPSNANSDDDILANIIPNEVKVDKWNK